MTIINRRIASGGDAGIWHETYLVNPGQYECIDHSMPPCGRGLAAVAPGA